MAYTDSPFQSTTAASGTPSTVTREVLLPGYVTEAELAAALGRCCRTVRRLGLPSVKVGAARFYDVAKCRAALLREDANAKNAPRRPGRPKRSV